MTSPIDFFDAKASTTERTDHHGCLLFTPNSATAHLTVAPPPGAFWARHAVGPAVPVAMHPFDGGFCASSGSVSPGCGRAISLPPGLASLGWGARLAPAQPDAVDGLHNRGAEMPDGSREGRP